MKVVAFVPAKGNSERVKNKNLTVVDGDYLFRKTLVKLLESTKIHEVYLDTDSDEIINHAKHLPIKIIKRPKELATNDTDGHKLFEFECSQVDADVYFQILCTAPLLSIQSIDAAVDALIKSDSDSLVGVHKFKSYLWKDGEPEYGRGKIPNSADLPEFIKETMSLYGVKRNKNSVISRRFGANPILFEISEMETIDIDNPCDLVLANTIMAGKRSKKAAELQLLKKYFSTALLYDITKSMGIKCILPHDIKSLNRNKIFGFAKTLELDVVNNRDKNDWLKIYDALKSYDFIQGGDVVVVKNNVPNTAYFGELNANLAIRAGACGAIIDGLVRDTQSLNALDFPVFAKGAYAKDIKFEGVTKSINMPITIGDVVIRNNDLVLGDQDGCVVIPSNKWLAVKQHALTILRQEVDIKFSILNHESVDLIVNNHGTF